MNMNKTSKNSSKIPCDACDHISPNVEAHKKHAEEVHKDGNKDMSYKCSECDVKATSSEGLKSISK